MSSYQDKKYITIVGCLPEPIGGVSIFCQRLLNTLSVESTNKFAFYDMYKGDKGNTLTGNVNVNEIGNSSRNMLFAIIKLCFHLRRQRSDCLFVNFSKASALYIIYIVAFFSRARKKQLCLHHGMLLSRNKFESFFFRYVLNSFDIVYALSSEQANFYEEHCTTPKIIQCNSYIEPSFECKASRESGGSIFKILVSGSSAKHYNLVPTLTGISEVATKFKNLGFEVTVSVYGESSYYIEKLKNSLIGTDNLNYIFTSDLSSDDFNFLLSKQNLYIRNTEVDSFGIIVADAINLGVSVLASNVCERYHGCFIFDYYDSCSFMEPLTLYLKGYKDSIPVSDIDFGTFPVNQLSR